MSIHKVVHAIIREGNRFLLGKRSPEKKYGPNSWASIGGRVEANESNEEALIRECREELGITVKIKKKLFERNIEERSAFHIWYLVEIESGKPYLANEEHLELKWMSLMEIEDVFPIFEEEIHVYKNLEMLE